MTVSSTTKRKQYAGSGNPGPFTIVLPITQPEDLKVVRTTTAGVDSTLTLDAMTSGYTVSTDLTTATLTEDLESGELVTFLYNIELTQETDILGNQPFPSTDVEASADRAVLVGHQLEEMLARSLRLKDSSEQSSPTIDDLEAGKFVMVNAGGTGLVMSETPAEDIEDSLALLAGYAAQLGAIGTVADNMADITLVADNITAVDTIYDNMADVLNVNGMETKIDDILALEDEMNAVLTALQPSSRNYVWNGQPSVWQRGTSFASNASARVRTADGWSLGEAALGTGVTVSRQTGDTAEFGMRVQRDNLSVLTDEINTVFNLTRADSWQLRGKSVVIGVKAKRGANFSGASNEMLLDVRYTTHTSEQAITNGSGTYATGDASVGSISCILGTSQADFKDTFTIPANATQVYVRARYQPSGVAGANDWFQIENVYLCPGAGTVTPRPASLGEIFREACRLYRKSFKTDTAPGTSTSEGAIRQGVATNSAGSTSDIHWHVNLSQNPMHGTPTVRLWSTGGAVDTATGTVSGTITVEAANISTNGFTVQNTSAPSAAQRYDVHFEAEYIL